MAAGTVWYDWYNQTAISVAAGENKTINAPLGHIPVYVRGGSILPMQLPGYTTAASRRNPWSLLVALNTEGSATGQLYLDDGESVAPNATRIVDITVVHGSLYASTRGLFQDTNPLANVTILGVPQQPSNATFNGQELQNVAYDSETQVVKITGLRNLTSSGAWAQDWTLTWQ